jgi:hypothetical protein
MIIEKIPFKGHYIWVDRSTLAKDGDYNFDGYSITKVDLNVPKYYGEGCHPIIAASTELNLEGIPMYSEYLAKKLDDRIQDPSFYDEGEWLIRKSAFIEGHKAAEKELFTEEDLRKAIVLSRRIFSIEGAVEINEHNLHEDYSGFKIAYTEDEIVENIKKPKK